MEENNLTELSKLGEFGLIDLLTKKFNTKHSSTIKAVGDDAAVFKYEQYGLVSTDMLIEGIHFDLSYVPLKHLGYKAVVVNLSDIYAMNAQPKQITVSIAISNRFTKEALEEIYDGIHTACEYYNIDLIGGDTTTSQSGLIISVSVIGEAPKENIVYRNGAKNGDLLVVSGDLGGAYMGLQVLEREKAVYLDNPHAQPDLEGFDYILERQLKPEARYDIVALLEKLEVKPTAMIDISDGLSSEVIHLCQNSKVGCQLYEEKIPIDPTVMTTAEEFNLHGAVCALNGGEDYELLFTIPQADYDKIKGNPNLSVIGHMTDESLGMKLVTRGGSVMELNAQGWDPILKQTDEPEEK